MSIPQTLGVLICVLAITIGQVLFKQIGLNIQLDNGKLSYHTLWLGVAALLFYGSATLLWVYLLRFIPLSRAYMFMSLSFVLVPLISAFYFNEHLSVRTYVGIALIVMGVIVSAELKST